MFKKAFIIGFGFFVGKHTAEILDYIVGTIYIRNMMLILRF